MGTLFKQPNREYKPIGKEEMEDLYQMVIEFSEEKELSFEQALKIVEILEKEKATNAYITDRDVHDEQMAGFGILLKDFNENIQEIIKIQKKKK